jgi:hypothetical protein
VGLFSREYRIRFAAPAGNLRKDRRRGLPGYTFRAFFEGVGSDVEITVRVSRTRSVPLALLDPLLVAAKAVAKAAKAVAKVEDLSWA